MRREDIQIGTRFIKNARILPPQERVPCPEPGCSSTLSRRWSEKLSRFYYMCDDPGCDGSVGCTPGGEIHGVPGDSKVKKARIEAHAVFDRLWKEGHFTRGSAYAEVGSKMGINPLHMGDLDAAQCREVIKIVNRMLNDLNAPEDGDDDGWFEVDN